jgi:hypothetical protein
MKMFCPILLGLSLTVAGITPAPAKGQSMNGASAPKYLQVIVEYTKPGKGGLAHDKTESAFVQTMVKAKFPIHYTAYNSLTGQARAIYLSAFDSLDEMDKASKVLEAPAIAPAYERVNVADGELLESNKSLIFESVPELSFHSKKPGPENRFLQAQVLLIRPGHSQEFEDLVKMVTAADEKVGSSAHWGAYRLRFGDQTGTYVLLTAANSMADFDQIFGETPKYMASLSDGDKKKMNELRAAAIESGHYELYSINPAQSYVDDDWIKADPKFWKPKATAAPAANPAAAPEKKTTP